MFLVGFIKYTVFKLVLLGFIEVLIDVGFWVKSLGEKRMVGGVD